MRQQGNASVVRRQDFLFSRQQSRENLFSADSCAAYAIVHACAVGFVGAHVPICSKALASVFVHALADLFIRLDAGKVVKTVEMITGLCHAVSQECQGYGGLDLQLLLFQ